MRASIVGAGYVGLVTGLCMAERGHTIVCADLDESKVDRLMSGQPTIHEVGLRELLDRHAGHGFAATTSVADAVRETEITLIAVGTPFDGTSIDLEQVGQATASIGEALAGGTRRHDVVVKSTVVPGTTDGLVRSVLERSSGRRVGEDIGLGVNPEFLTEGQAIADFMHPDRIVIGGSDRQTLDSLAALYRPFTGVPLIRTNNATAEMIKYASNSLLATMISFSNELADLCSALGGIDAMEVMAAVHESSYLTVRSDDTSQIRAPLARFLEPGCGFGGSCLPKDVSALVEHGSSHGVDMSVLRSVLQVNRSRPQRVIDSLKRRLPELHGRTVAVLGLAFKPDTDDIRESPAFPIIDLLLDEGARVTAYDPVSSETARRALSDTTVQICSSLGEAISSADVIVIVTRWKEFDALPDELRRMGHSPLVFDGRRMLDKHSVTHYDGVGL